MIRAFIGLEVPDDVTRILVGAQAGLSIGRHVPPENLHLTLAFLGQQRAPMLEDVHDALQGITADAISVRLSGLGVFGGLAPRTLFAEVAPDPALTSLRKKVNRAVSQSGIHMPHERFHPHITLARFGQGLCGPDALELQAFISRRMAQVRGQFIAPAFQMFESRLGGEGASYEVLASYPLRAPLGLHASASNPSVAGSNS